MNVLKGDHVTVNEDGSVEVAVLMDGQLVSKVLPSVEQLADAATVVTTGDMAIAIALASWLGIDPSRGNPQLFTDYQVEVDFTQVQPIRRTLLF